MVGEARKLQRRQLVYMYQKALTRNKRIQPLISIYCETESGSIMKKAVAFSCVPTGEASSPDTGYNNN